MDKTRDFFSRNIYKLRESLNLNQDEVADRLGVNLRTYQKYEYGQAYPRPDKMSRLAEIFGVSSAELISGPKKAKTVGKLSRAEMALAIQEKVLALSDDRMETVLEFLNDLENLENEPFLEAHDEASND